MSVEATGPSSPSASTPSAAVKELTASRHRRAESHPFQQSLISGLATREAYVAYLEQMYLVHQVLETQLRRHAGAPAIAAVVREWQYQQPYLAQDLAFFGVAADSVQPLPATARLCDQIEAADPVALLGFHYVLEGSNNGSPYVAKAVARSLGLSTEGLCYLNPYGDAQRGRWAEFKGALDVAPMSAEEIGRFVAGAESLYDGLQVIFDELDTAAGHGKTQAEAERADQRVTVVVNDRVEAEGV